MDDIFNKKIDELIIKFANEYPISYASEILCYMFDELNSNNFIIKLCNEIWKYTPSTILTYDELMDASILAQLSYNTHLLFLSLPDICDYPNEWTKNFKLNQRKKWMKREEDSWNSNFGWQREESRFNLKVLYSKIK